jgi:hypothetical protein
MVETKTQSKFKYMGFGFPVTLSNVPMIKVRGFWTPNINYNTLGDKVYSLLKNKKSKLTNEQVNFIKHYQANKKGMKS